MASGNAAGPVMNVDPTDAWRRLEVESSAQLIDVRTVAELTFVGAPDLSSIGKGTIFVEWQSFPNQAVDASFGAACRERVVAAGADERSELYFICRSGSRSMSAARAMREQGFTACHNVEHGFEGPLDETGHRGNLSGWKKAGLPWAQG